VSLGFSLSLNLDWLIFLAISGKTIRIEYGASKMENRGGFVFWRPAFAVCLSMLIVMPGAAFADRESKHSSRSSYEGDGHSSNFSIDNASWNRRRARLEVSGSGQRDASVTVSNADTASVIGSERTDRRGNWRLTVRHPASVPCRVLAVQSNGQSAERDVSGAPSDCDAGNGSSNNAPVANANGPYAGTTGQAISFSSAGSNDADGSIASYAWNFGDGGSSSQANPSHSYSAAGSYNVTLTVTDNDGATATDNTTASVEDPTQVNQPPVAHANGPYSGTTGQAISFSSAGSNDPDGSIASYAWNFGDGGSSSQANPSHS
jgi:PKD repeat protein